MTRCAESYSTWSEGRGHLEPHTVEITLEAMNLYLAEAVAMIVSLWIGAEALREWRCSRRRSSETWRRAHRNIDDAQKASVESLPIIEETRKAA